MTHLPSGANPGGGRAREVTRKEHMDTTAIIGIVAGLLSVVLNQICNSIRARHQAKEARRNIVLAERIRIYNKANELVSVLEDLWPPKSTHNAFSLTGEHAEKCANWFQRHELELDDKAREAFKAAYWAVERYLYRRGEISDSDRRNLCHEIPDLILQAKMALVEGSKAL